MLEATSAFASSVSQNQSTVPTFSAAKIAGLLARGDWLFATGDIASARVLYERTADAGAARAAMKLGETFDPFYLRSSHPHGLRSDPGTAVSGIVAPVTFAPRKSAVGWKGSKE
jgi:hypothetical protein